MVARWRDDVAVRTVVFVQGAGERGGAERILLTLANGLPEHGFEPVVAFLADGPFVDEVRAAGIRVLQLGAAPRARELNRWPSVVRRLADAAASVRPTVVVGNGEKVSPWTGWAARRIGAASVFWLHDAPGRDAASTGLQALMRVTPHDASVAGSAWMAGEFQKKLRLSARVIRHGIDPPPPAADIRRAAGWPEGVPVVAHFGRLQRWKGADVFLRAAAQVAQTSNARFAVVGGALYGWEQDFAASLPRLADELGIAELVWFAGHRDDARALMGTCDVVVHASVRDEPLGLVVAEAMAARAAVVATRTRGPEELVVDGETGMLVRPGDAGDLAGAVGRLVADAALHGQVAAAGQAYVNAEWSAATMVRQHATLYAELAARRSHGAA